MTEPGRTPSSRAANIERLRVLAVLDIIGFHVTGTRDTALFGGGLVAFLLLAQLFNTALSEQMGVGPFVRTKLRRLLWPWLAWSAIYGTWLIARSIRHDEPWTTRFEIEMLAYGTSEHLWFVPFSAFTGVAVALIQHRLRRTRTSVLLVAGVAMGTLLVVTGALLIDRKIYEVPVAQYLYAMPAPFFGFALGRLWLHPDEARRRQWSLVIGGVAVLMLAGRFAFDGPAVFARWSAMIAVILLLMEWRGELDFLTRLLSPLLYGVYLVHMLWVELSSRVHWLMEHPSLRVLAVFVVSVVMTKALKATPLRAIV